MVWPGLRVVVLMLGVTECGLLAGIVFGWPSLAHVLTAHGYFRPPIPRAHHRAQPPAQPTADTTIHSPTRQATHEPTRALTHSPARKPTRPPAAHKPTRSPTRSPAYSPARSPTYSPAHSPAHKPTHAPTQPPTHPHHRRLAVDRTLAASNSTDGRFPTEVGDAEEQQRLVVEQQQRALSWVFLAASFVTNVASLPCGVMADRAGASAARLLAIVLYLTSTLTIAYSTPDSAWLLFPAVSTLSVSGILMLITNMQVGSLFGRRQATVVSLYNGAYDSSAFTLIVVKWLHEAGISLRSAFLGLAACSLLTTVLTALLYSPLTQFCAGIRGGRTKWRPSQNGRPSCAEAETGRAGARPLARQEAEPLILQEMTSLAKQEVVGAKQEVRSLAGQEVDGTEQEVMSGLAQEGAGSKMSLAGQEVVGTQQEVRLLAGQEVVGTQQEVRSLAGQEVGGTEQEVRSLSGQEVGVEVTSSLGQESAGSKQDVMSLAGQEVVGTQQEVRSLGGQEIGSTKQDAGSPAAQEVGSAAQEARSPAGQEVRSLAAQEVDGAAQEVTSWDGAGTAAEAPSLRRSVLSPVFVAHVLWLSLVQLRHCFYLGSLHAALTERANGDADTVEWYLDVFAWTQLLGLACAPWSGLMMDRARRADTHADAHRDSHRDSSRDSNKDSHRDLHTDSHKDSSKDSQKISYARERTDSQTDSHRDSHRDSHTDSDRDSHRDSHADAHRDSNKESHKDSRTHQATKEPLAHPRVVRACVPALALVSAQCVLLSVCASLPTPGWFATSFVLQVVNRASLYASSAAFIAIVFPRQHMASLYGCSVFVSAILNLPQYAAVEVTGGGAAPHNVTVSMLLMVVSLLSFAHPAYLYIRSQRLLTLGDTGREGERRRDT